MTKVYVDTNNNKREYVRIVDACHTALEAIERCYNDGSIEEPDANDAFSAVLGMMQSLWRGEPVAHEWKQPLGVDPTKY